MTKITKENIHNIIMNAVDSSNVAAIGYDKTSQYLRVDFKAKPPATVTSYLYADVPLDIYTALMESPSKGAYIAKEIKGKFPSVKFDENSENSPCV